MVVLDSSILLLLLHPTANPPRDADGKLIGRARDRIVHLVERLTAAKTLVIVPTPVLAEVLVRTTGEEASKILEILQRKAVFQIAPFDVRCAIDLAAMSASGRPPARGKKKLTEVETYAKLKFDRQIVAIASVAGATAIYSDDGGLRDVAKRKHIDVIGLGELPLPERASDNLELFDAES